MGRFRDLKRALYKIRLHYRLRENGITQPRISIFGVQEDFLPSKEPAKEQSLLRLLRRPVALLIPRRILVVRDGFSDGYINSAIMVKGRILCYFSSFERILVLYLLLGLGLFVPVWLPPPPWPPPRPPRPTRPRRPRRPRRDQPVGHHQDIRLLAPAGRRRLVHLFHPEGAAIRHFSVELQDWPDVIDASNEIQGVSSGCMPWLS